jgi:hypothetical protein
LASDAAVNVFPTQWFASGRECFASDQECFASDQECFASDQECFASGQEWYASGRECFMSENDWYTSDRDWYVSKRDWYASKIELNVSRKGLYASGAASIRHPRALCGERRGLFSVPPALFRQRHRLVPAPPARFPHGPPIALVARATDQRIQAMFQRVRRRAPNAQHLFFDVRALCELGPALFGVERERVLVTQRRTHDARTLIPAS